MPKKLRAPFSVLGLAILCSLTPCQAFALGEQTVPVLKRIAHQPAICPFDSIFLEGEATNLTAHASTGVVMQIRCSSGLLRATGQYDSRKLFGRFDIDGKFVPHCKSKDALCMDFAGDLLLGDDGSGFPSGTKAKYAMNITYNPVAASGTYKVGLVPRFITHPQYGTLVLRSRENPGSAPNQ